MAHHRQADPAAQHHHPVPAATLAGTQSGREHMAIHPRKLAVKSRLPILQPDHRPVLLRLEQARRTAMDHHVHRIAQVGASVLTGAGWYDFRLETRVRRVCLFKPLRRLICVRGASWCEISNGIRKPPYGPCG